MTETLHVGNVGDGVTDQHLWDLFGGVRGATTARVMIDGKTGKRRGFALVEMANFEDAESAVRSLNGFLLDGRVLTVRRAVPRGPGWEGGNDQGGSNRSHGLGAGNGGSRW